MSVSEYGVRFSDLSRHVLALVATVREQVCRFIEGLNQSIRFSMTRELELDTPYHHVVEIARRLEGMRDRDREDREAKRPHGRGGFSSGHAAASAHHGRGYVSRLVHSALPSSSGAPVVSRSQVAHFAQPLSNVPPARGAFNGQSNRPGLSHSYPPHPPRDCFKCGDTHHMVRDCPRLSRGAPSQTTQALRIQSGPQAS
ncbi:uncharacterized protein [Nicotiana tomentosiformis]|uniref:uncharacterized protein n=1 Tax=Nicotiana tomentosiformis TaxID=4098 RepID=UPI00388C68EE